jgi:peptidoglycan/LPS O-acetylase OafA/YrhL
MAPNFMAFGIPGIGGGFHLSSIGTEEQFYMFWPWLIKWVENLLIPLFLIFIVFALAPNLLDYLNNNFFEKKSTTYQFIQQLRIFTEYFKIDCMALGGVFAFFYFKKKNKILNFLFLRNTQIISILVGVGFWLFGINIPIFRDEFFALFFAVIILNTAVNPNKIISFDYKWLNYIGKISYGIYVYHWIIILFVMNIIIQVKENLFLFNSLLYAGSISLTILIAHFSFFKFERYFLKFKDRFTQINSKSINQ